MIELKINAFLNKWTYFIWMSLIKIYPGINKLLLYNCHIIIYYPEAVRNLGPLRSHSAYNWEFKMGYFKTLTKSYNNIPQQILNKYNLTINNLMF